MSKANFTVSSMHRDMPQKERESIMKEFRSGARWGRRGGLGWWATGLGGWAGRRP